MIEHLTVGTAVATEPWAQPRAGVLRRSVFALDAHLRRRYGIVEFTAQPDCLLRIAPTRAPRDLDLSDGTRIRRGDPLLDLHLWNEHVPTIPPAGLTLRWAAAAAHCTRASLRALAAAAQAGTVPEFVALRGCLRFDGRLLDAPFAGCGFDTIAEGSASPTEWLHGLGETCLLGMLLWAFNPAGLGHARLIRARRSVWMSRERLLARHGPAQR
ncbi:MAG: hypothetical protein KGL11_02340 [Alphaproteobacteria bacterium]|nr:hypothetical protein [Alphaproteobacteria bacterium]